MSEDLNFQSLIAEVKELHSLLTKGEPTPDEEIEARDKFIQLFENLRAVATEPKIQTLIEESLEKLESWDALELWFNEVPDLSKKINQLIKVTGIELSGPSSPLQESPGSQVTEKSREPANIDVEQVVEKVSEQFKSEISALKDEIKRLQGEFTQKESIIEEDRETSRKPTIPIKEQSGKKEEIKLTPPEIKIPKLILPKKSTPFKREFSTAEKIEEANVVQLEGIEEEKGHSDKLTDRVKKLEELISPIKKEIPDEEKPSEEFPLITQDEIQSFEEPTNLKKVEQLIPPDIKKQSILDKDLREMIQEKESTDIISEITKDSLETGPSLESTDKDQISSGEFEQPKIPDFEVSEIFREPEFVHESIQSSTEQSLDQGNPPNKIIDTELNSIESQIKGPPPPIIFKSTEKLSPIPVDPTKAKTKSENLSPVPEKPDMHSSDLPAKKSKITLEVREEPTLREESTTVPFIAAQKSKKHVSIVSEVIEEASPMTKDAAGPFVQKKVSKKDADQALPMSTTDKKSDKEKEDATAIPFLLNIQKEKKGDQGRDLSNHLKTSGSTLYNTFASLGKESPILDTKKKKETPPSSKTSINSKKTSRIQTKGGDQGERAISEDVIPLDINAFPRDKDKLYQELISFEGKRYNIEKKHKELEEKHNNGLLDDFEFNNEAMKLKKALDTITNTINSIRQIISSL